MNKKIFFDVKVLALISLAVIAFSVSVYLFQDKNEAETLEFDGELKAVIIDQLYDDIPRDWFHQRASDMLEEAGYKVDIFTTQNVTVDFYKELPSMNYKFIVIRSHGVYDKNNDSVDLFTGERYQEDKYISEQLFGQVAKGAPLQVVIFQPDMDNAEWTTVNYTTRMLSTPVNLELRTDEEYFLITPKLIDELMVGKFPGSIFVIGGCSSLESTSMAESLVNRGASSVVGWDDLVGDYENDLLMLYLLEETLIRNTEISEAVNLVMEEYYNSYVTLANATLKHYPGFNL